jgi:hypothetical protein
MTCVHFSSKCPSSSARLHTQALPAWYGGLGLNQNLKTRTHYTGVLRENTSRIQHKYKIGDQVLLNKPGLLRKSTQPRTGPHTVTKTYQNSTVQLK